MPALLRQWLLEHYAHVPHQHICLHTTAFHVTVIIWRLASYRQTQKRSTHSTYPRKDIFETSLCTNGSVGEQTGRVMKHCSFLLQVVLMLFWYGGNWLREHHKPRAWLPWTSRTIAALSRRPAWNHHDLPVHALMSMTEMDGSSGCVQGPLTLEATPPALGRVAAGRRAHEEAQQSRIGPLV